tara:strand:- start:3200 stop:3454 length:255 start_codon:yes stop_codon:yes gene_type:complete
MGDVEKYRKKIWMPAVLNHLKQMQRPLSYDEIINGTVMLSIMPKKNLRQTRTCPSKKQFTKTMCYIEEVESFLEKRTRFWRIIE